MVSPFTIWGAKKAAVELSGWFCRIGWWKHAFFFNDPPLFSGVPLQHSGAVHCFMGRDRDGSSGAGVGRVRRAAFSGALLVVGGLLLTTTGCTTPLLTPNEERSQYDRFDTIRAQRAPTFIEDEFGRRRPNLRGRLLGRESS